MYQLNFAQGSVSNASPLPVSVATAPTTTVEPSIHAKDAYNRFLTTGSTSLIGDSFQYSQKMDKYETLNLMNNRPNVFPKTTHYQFHLTALSGGNQAPDSIMTGTTNINHGMTTGDIVYIQGSSNPKCDGIFVLTSASGSSFTYYASGQVSGSVFYDHLQTTVRPGDLYDDAPIAVSSASGNGQSPAVITVNTSVHHGLLPGMPITIHGATTTSVNGQWVVSQVDTPTRFAFRCATNSVTTVTTGSIQLYALPNAYVSANPLDASITATTGIDNFVGGQMIRQSKEYVKYAHGSSLSYKTSASFVPLMQVRALSGSSTTATVQTEHPHNLQVGAHVQISGVHVDTGTDTYTGTFEVQSITDIDTFTYTMANTPQDTTPTGRIFACPVMWSGAAVRHGLYDDQHGCYFEHDGTTMNACLRESSEQLTGRISVNVNNTTVTGYNTKFRNELIAMDMIVIRGMSYKVLNVASDTSITISPAYRGAINVARDTITKTKTHKFPQSAWNLDTLDGNGASGWTLDPTKIQSVHIDVAWSGSGYIRWGFVRDDGSLVHCHHVSFANMMFRSYLKSASLPVRFEVSTEPAYSRLVSGVAASKGSSLGTADSTMYVESIEGFPSAGIVLISNGTNAEVCEYTGIGSWDNVAGGYPLSGLTRRTSHDIAGLNHYGTFSNAAYALTGTTSSVVFTPDASVGGAGTNQVSVISLLNTCSPLTSQYNVSVNSETGAKYDSRHHSVSMMRYTNVAASNVSPLLAVRISPSADSEYTGKLGIRNVINRIAMDIEELHVSSQGQFSIEGYLNPWTVTGNTTSDFASVEHNSLAEIIYFNGTSTPGAPVNATANITGGDRVFSFYTDSSGTDFRTETFKTKVDLHQSILSGDEWYPQGPDTLVVCARNLSTTTASNVACRMSWTE